MPSRRRLTTTLLMSVAQMHAARQDREQGTEATATGAERGACMETSHLEMAWRLRPAARHSSRLVPWTTRPCILRQAPRPHSLRDRRWPWHRSACNVACDVAWKPLSRWPPARHLPVARSRVAPFEREGSMISRAVALASLLLVVASCAGVAEQHSVSAKPSAGSEPARIRGAEPEDSDAMRICVMERPTGSNIAEQVCRRATEGESRRMRAQDSLVLPRASPPTGASTTGGH